MRSFVDVLLIASFEVKRAVRTWRAMAMGLIYCIGMGGGVWVFTKLLYAAEKAAAETMQVAVPSKPGVLIKEAMEREDFREMVVNATGNTEVMKMLDVVPILALVVMMIGVAMLPFFAATASAECISLDRSNRALRYEIARTGRLEFVFGRYLGQATLSLTATAVSAMVAWGGGIYLMAGQDPGTLLFYIALFLLKAWVFSLPFLGLGVCISQMSSSPAWSRVLVLGLTVGSWPIYWALLGLAQIDSLAQLEVVSRLFPHHWVSYLWVGNFDFLIAAMVLAIQSLLLVLLGFVRFWRVDL